MPRFIPKNKPQNPREEKETKVLSVNQKKAVDIIVKKNLKANDELKYFGHGVSSADVFATATMSTTEGFRYTHITGISQGAADNNRVGDSLNLKSIHVTLGMSQTSGAGTASFNWIRCIVFQKIGSSSTAPVGSEIFNADIPSGTVSVFSHRNVDFTHIYHILYDQVHLIVNNPSATSTSLPMNYAKLIQIHVPMKYCRKKLKYSAAGTDPDCPVYVATLGDKADNGSGNPTAYWQARIRFTDS